jgi:hypothetical protein
MLSLKFHEPGLAPTLDTTGAYHVNREGTPAYAARFIRVFGFYDLRAAVQSRDGWYHILQDGSPLYENRYAWCGNFQQNHCTVKDLSGRYFHINQKGEKAYPFTFKYAGDFRDGYAVVLGDDGFYTHIDFSGQLLHGKKFLDLDIFHKGYARAQDRKGWFHIDSQGKSCYSTRYKSVEPFYNGVSRVEAFSGAFLLINEQGETLATVREPLQDKKGEFHEVSADLVSYWRFYTLDAACHLKIFDYLPATTSQISDQLSIPLRTTEKLLKALAEMEYISQHPDQWMLSSKGQFLTSHHPLSLTAAQQLWKEEHLTAWQNLLYSLKTEKPAFEHLFDKPWFDYLKDKDEKTRLYHQALSSYAKCDYNTITSHINFKKHQSVIDIGGSSGALLFEILEKNTHLFGTLLDLPSVISLIQIPPHLKNRIQLVPLDFFSPWPIVKADCAILSRILHDWSDQKALHILQNVYHIVTDTLYVIENTASAPLLDLNMLVMTEGHERTLEDFKKLLNKAQFRLETSYPLNEVSSLITSKKLS